MGADGLTARHVGAYFGAPWPSGVCETGTRVPTPVGELCSYCDEVIGADDRGSFMGNGVWAERPTLVPIHRECAVRIATGGIGHLQDHQRWCEEEHDPDGGMTPRQSALAVWDHVHRFGWSP